VNPLTEAEVRASFVNCSRGEVKRAYVPNLSSVSWNDHDFLGWRDPKAPDRAYMVAPWANRIVGLTLRSNVKRPKTLFRSSMCSICLTVHASSGVSTFAARRVGESGRNGNTIGGYWCTNLNCSLYVRGILHSEAAVFMEETLEVGERIERLRGKLDQFLSKVMESEAR
jgi:hypothetical protein